MFKKLRIRNSNSFFKGYVFFRRVSKKTILVCRKIHRNRFKSIFRDLNLFKIFKEIDLNRFKMDLSEILMDLSEIRMDFSKSVNPSKSI